ncbi:MAG: TonB-dependent receptor, partial [Verrucomicrobiota bacterium]
MEGYESTLTANITKNLRLQANYSYTRGYDANVAPEVRAWSAEAFPYYRSFTVAQGIAGSDGRTIPQIISDWEIRAAQNWTLEGVTLKGNRRHKVSGFARYNLPWERVKGAFIGGGYRHNSKSELTVDAQNNILYGNSYWLADAMMGYQIRRVPFLKRGITLQLNVSNVFAYDKPVTVSFNADGSVYHWNIMEPRQWRLTASTEF